MFIQIGYTLFRLNCGVILGLILALPVAILMSTTPTLRRLINPSVSICSNVPVIVWIPFAVMLVGTEEAFKVSLVAISAFFITTTMVFDAAAKTHLPFLEAGRALHFHGLTLIRHVVLPAVLPAVIGALRASIAFGWVVVFFVEYASARAGSEGLGWRIADARSMGRIEEEFAGLILLGIVALLLDRLVNYGQKRALSWMHIAEVT
ncbi:MAG: ABC transporter permease subunit [Rhodopirellula sp.]|nr:ABC transporter permease subunit [Rhodopirellula sp.]